MWIHFDGFFFILFILYLIKNHNLCHTFMAISSTSPPIYMSFGFGQLRDESNRYFAKAEHRVMKLGTSFINSYRLNWCLSLSFLRFINCFATPNLCDTNVIHLLLTLLWFGFCIFEENVRLQFFFFALFNLFKQFQL